MAHLWETGRGRLSVQVLQEYSVSVTAKLDPGLDTEDALIVAAARRLGCTTLLTEDLRDGQELGGVGIRSPFTHDP